MHLRAATTVDGRDRKQLERIEVELKPPGAGVAELVGQPLLGDPEQGEPDGRRQPWPGSRR